MKLDKDSPLLIPAVLAAVAFALQMLTAGNYGIFQDEYYYAACAQHLAFGYVDHPAVAPLLTGISLLFGKSVYALRFFPSLAMAGTVMIAALAALALGGSRFAAAFSSLALLDGTIFWALFGFISVNAFDIFMVALAGYLLILTMQSPTLRNWIFLGLVMGVGLNTKMTMLTFGFGLFVGLLLTSQRKQLLALPPYIAGLIAFVMFLPFLLWQWANGWPTLEFIRNASQKNLNLTLPQFFAAHLVATGPVVMLLCVAGLILLFRKPVPASVRAVAVASATFFAVYVINRSNFYYVVPGMPILVAAGSVSVERWTVGKSRLWIRYGVVGLVATSALLKLPLGIPLLPMTSFFTYSRAIMGSGNAEKTRTDKTQSTTVPLHFGKRFGDKELVEKIASVYHALPDSDKMECGIVAINYTFAGAVDYYGPGLDLPPAVSGHNSYWLWGPGPYSGKVMIAAGASGPYWERFFTHVESVATSEFPYEGPNNRVVNIFICRGPKEPLPQMWHKLKSIG